MAAALAATGQRETFNGLQPAEDECGRQRSAIGAVASRLGPAVGHGPLGDRGF